MERRLGFDLRRVRIHTDDRAARSADEVGALAYTVGADIVFAHGRYRPHSHVGRALLAHELTHVAQNTGLTYNGQPLEIGRQTDRTEAEAAAIGRLVTTSEAPVKGHFPTKAGQQATILRRQAVPSPAPSLPTGTALSLGERLLLDAKEKVLTVWSALACAGVRIPERLERDPSPTATEQVRKLEERRDLVDKLAERQREYEDLKSKDESTLTPMEKQKFRALAPLLDIGDNFLAQDLVPGEAKPSYDEWSARTRCELARAQLKVVQEALGRPRIRARTGP